MAVTGFCLAIFVLFHLIGNTTVFWGAEALDGYAAKLHASGPLLLVLEMMLGTVFATHIILALVLYAENRKARSISHGVKKTIPPSQWAGYWMPYTGLALFLFIIVHLVHFRMGRKGLTATETMNGIFADPWWLMFYLLILVALFLHLSHGLWSMLQTLGFNHSKYDGAMGVSSRIISFMITGIFAVVALSRLFT